jgi:hypothetical protein
MLISPELASVLASMITRLHRLNGGTVPLTAGTTRTNVSWATGKARGAFDWLPIDDEVFAFTTDLLRSVGTFLYGRHRYEAMAVRETDAAPAAQSDLASGR